MNNDTNDIIISMKQVLEITGVCESTIKILVKAGKFPKKIKLSTRRVDWSRNDIENCVNNLERVICK